MLDLTVDKLQSAWERVQQNAGCAGVDGITTEHFEREAQSELPDLLARVEGGDYRSLPLRKLVVEKRPGHTRSLAIPTVEDRIVQTAVARRLSLSFEEEFFDASYAYRRDRGVDRAIARIVQLRDLGWTWLADADISSFFDSVSHPHILKLLREDAASASAFPLLRLWIECDVWDGRALHPLRRGVPQGSPISPLFANFFLTPFDRAIEETGNHLVRYSDDFLILCRTREDATHALETTSQLLSAEGLALNPDKSRIGGFEEGFTFLGVTFRGKEVYVPWKMPSHDGRVVFLAHCMPQRLLRSYRKERAAKPLSAAPPVSLGEAHLVTEARNMPFLYVVEQGSILRKSGDRFLVEHDQTIALDVPYQRIETILLFGNVQVTTQAMVEALDKGIKFSLFTRNGRLRGVLAPAGGRNVSLRVAQYRLYEDQPRAVALARAIIRRKIENCRSVLERYEERDQSGGASPAALDTIQSALGSLEAAASRAEIDGCEGAAARAYFDEFMRFNRSEFEWPGRVKHPATDPLNALLSLSYTLLMNELAALAEAAGLDSALGILHELDGARPSLALDLMEPFRGPMADRFVLTSVNRGVFRPNDFEARDAHGSVVLKPQAMRTFFAQYEMWMVAPISHAAGARQTFRDALENEVLGFTKALEVGGPWEPFRFPVREEKPDDRAQGAAS